MKTKGNKQAFKRRGWIFLSLVILGLTWGVLLRKELKLGKFQSLLEQKTWTHWVMAIENQSDRATHFLSGKNEQEGSLFIKNFD